MTAAEKIPEESAKAKRACDLYLSMGLDRSMAKVAEMLGHPASYKRQLEYWSSWYHWSERAARYDEEQLERKRKIRQNKLDKLYDQLEEVCQDQLGKTLQDLEKLRNSENGLSNIATVNLFKIVTDTLMHVLGDDDKQKIEITGKDEGPLEVEVTTFWGRGTDPRRKSTEEAPQITEESEVSVEFGADIPDDEEDSDEEE